MCLLRDRRRGESSHVLTAHPRSAAALSTEAYGGTHPRIEHPGNPTLYRSEFELNGLGSGVVVPGPLPFTKEQSHLRRIHVVGTGRKASVQKERKDTMPIL